MNVHSENSTFHSERISECDRDNQRSLRAAIRSKEIDVVRHLIGNGTDANGYPSNISYERPLHLAVISRSLEIVGILLNSGANVDVMSEEGETPLILAARLENIAVIDLLLSRTKRNCEFGHYNLSHLHIACMRNNTNLVRKFLLMTHGRHINKAVRKESMCWAGFTPLHFAVQYGCSETVELLLESGADITAMDARQMTPLHLAHLQRNEEIVDLILMKHKFEHRNPIDAAGISHFHISCTRDDPSIVKHFLRSDVDPDLKVKLSPKHGWRPIHFALYYECPKVLKLLLESKINLFVPTNLLEHMFRMGNQSINDLITSRKFKFQRSCQNDDYMTIFHQACIKNETTKIEEMLSSSEICAHLNEPIWTGCTPLHLAVRSNSAHVTKLLLDQGADPMIQDDQGRTSLHLAFEFRYDKVSNNILESLASVSLNLADNSGLSIFHILCSSNNVRAIESLISKGVDINAQVWDDSVHWAGFTPMHFAVQFRQLEVVILLLKNGADASIKNKMDLNSVDVLLDRLDEHFGWIQIERNISDILMTIFSSLPADVKGSVFRAMSPLHALCLSNYTDLAVLEQNLILYEDEINRIVNLPNSRHSDKCTALHLAMQREQFNVAKMLLEKGADPLMVNSKGETPLESAAASLGMRWDDEFNLESLFPLETPIENFKPSHFHLACSFGLTNVVKHVLSKVTDPNLKMKFINCLDDNGWTPLLTLLYLNEGRLNELPKKEITLLLLENGADVNARDFELTTALHWSEHPEDFDVTRMLVSYGADVNAQNVYGRTPLGAAVNMSFIEYNNNNGKLISLLLESGADVNIVDKHGQTCMSKEFSRRENRNLGICILPLLKHIKKFEVIGFPINDLNKQAYIEYLEEFRELFNERAFVDECQKELESMANVKIDNYTSLYSILFKTPHQMVFHSNNVNLEAMVAPHENCEKFPIYGFLIRLQIKKGKIRKPLLQKSEESFIVLSRKALPSVCLEAVFQYLADSDLKNLNQSISRSDGRGRDTLS